MLEREEQSDLLPVAKRETLDPPVEADLKPIRKLVSDWTGIYQYTIDQVFMDMIERCRQLNLRLAVTEDQARLEFPVLLTVQAMNYLHEGGHRVAL